MDSEDDPRTVSDSESLPAPPGFHYFRVTLTRRSGRHRGSRTQSSKARTCRPCLCGARRLGRSPGGPARTAAIAAAAPEDLPASGTEVRTRSSKPGTQLARRLRARVDGAKSRGFEGEGLVEATSQLACSGASALLPWPSLQTGASELRSTCTKDQVDARQRVVSR